MNWEKTIQRLPLQLTVYASETEIFYVAEGSQEPVKIGEYGIYNYLSFKALSDDGNKIVWTERDGKTEDVYLRENGSEEKVASFVNTSEKSIVNVKYNRNMTFWIIYDDESEYIYMKDHDKPAQKVNLGTSKGRPYFYTERCILDLDASDNRL